MNKKKEPKVVPNVRFKGFTDDWKQRKLADYLEVSSEKNRDNRFTKEDVLSVSGEYGIVNQIEFQGRSFAGASVSNYGIVENGDVVYTKSPLKSNPYGIIKTNKGISGIVSTLYAVYKPKKITDSKFVQIYFELDSRMNSYMRPLVNKGAKNDMKVSAENALKGMVSFPKKDEQEMISLYFSTLDNLITLHQQKITRLIKLKKAMLEKMFPKKGSVIPEIRFNGFANAWEQRKLGNVAKFSKGSGYSKGDLIESGTPIILYGRLYTKYETSISEVDTYVEAKDGSVYSKGGEVIVPASGETAEDIARAATVDKSGVILGGDLNVVSPNEDINSAFLAISISHGNSQRELAKKAQGKSVVHIHNEEIKNLVVPFPTKAEQNKIVEYFSNLDNLITLHQRKIDKIKNMKKAMLNQMFI